VNRGYSPRDVRAPRARLGRRAFLASAASAGLAAGGLGALLTGCGTDPTAPRQAPLPEPTHPVTWPVYSDNKPIANGLPPEADGTLSIYTWPDRVSQRCLDDFSKAHRCEVRRTTFTTITEALSRLIRGRERFDVFMGVPTSLIGLLVARSLIQPLNHTYIPNITQAWPLFTDPYYDSHWQYTVPYTVYTTGIAWRKDLVNADPYALVNGWSFPWVAGGEGTTMILDDYRASISLGLLKDGVRDLGTADPLLIDNAARSLTDLADRVGLRISNATSAQIASGQSWVHHAWSGQAVAAVRLLPHGVPADAIGYWFPPAGDGPVANDTNTVLVGAKNPVLGHLFLNFMLERANVMHNIAATGYAQPLTWVTPSRLVSHGILPSALTSAAVPSTFFDRGLKEFEIPVAADELWQQAWRGVVRASRRLAILT
jgi:spermidine/putrescine transport system substrate-binding protein